MAFAHALQTMIAGVYSVTTTISSKGLTSPQSLQVKVTPPAPPVFTIFVSVATVLLLVIDRFSR
jgi:hypothetical protein